MGMVLFVLYYMNLLKTNIFFIKMPNYFIGFIGDCTPCL